MLKFTTPGLSVVLGLLLQLYSCHIPLRWLRHLGQLLLHRHNVGHNALVAACAPSVEDNILQVTSLDGSRAAYDFDVRLTRLLVHPAFTIQGQGRAMCRDMPYLSTLVSALWRIPWLISTRCLLCGPCLPR